MTAPVSIVVPALGDRELLARCLESVEAELATRDADDELLVVDDTGRDELAAWLTERFARARVLRRRDNGGFARALADGIDAARQDLVFCMNSDLVGRPGFLAPLVERLAQPDVFAVVPCVLRRGSGGVESYVRVELVDGGARILQPLLESDGEPPREAVPVPFALGGACLFRASEFAALGGFDPLFEPFYLEDVDLCWRAWRSGRRVMLEPRAVCEHENQATIGRVATPELRDAAIDRNGLLFLWKHLDGDELAAHVAGLARRARRAWLLEDRAELVRLALALEEADAVLAARAAVPASRRSFAEVLDASDPLTRD